MFFYNNKKENEKFLDMKIINEEKNTYIKSNYNTTLEDISFFLGLIGDGKISDEKGVYFYSKFGQCNEITPNGFPRFFIIAKLIRDGFLRSDMIDYICTFREEPQELKEFMKSMELRKEQRLPNVKKEYNTPFIFKNYFDRFISLVGVGDDFNMQISTNPLFVHRFFKLIEEQKGFKGVDKNAIGLGLFNDINGYLQGKTNYTGKVELSYNIETYIEQKRYIYPILASLEKSRNIVISDICIREFRIIFELEGFSDFRESLFVEKTEPKTNKTEDNERECSFNKETGDFIYGGFKPHRFKKGSDRYIIMKMIFDVNKFERVDFIDVIEEIEGKKIDEIKDFDTKKKNLNTSILDIRKNVIEKKYNIKEFFKVEDRAYYRQH